MYSSYFQARVKKSQTYFFVATLRSFEHVCFDRTLDKEQGIFEFFVPPAQENFFCKMMQWYQDQGIIDNFEKKENRLHNYI
jgi:hypothetical protein